MSDLILSLVIGAILISAILYVRKEKKKGVKCIGCADCPGCHSANNTCNSNSINGSD